MSKSFNEGPGINSDFSDKLNESRARIAEFANQRAASTPPEANPSTSIDATPPIVLTKEDREFLRQTNLTDEQIDALDYDELIDIFHARHDAHEAKMRSSTESEAPLAPEGVVKAETTIEEKLRLGALGWTVDQRNKLRRAEAEFILNHSLSPDTVPPLTFSDPSIIEDEEPIKEASTETPLELKTRMRKSVLELDGLSKAQQKEMYARAFEQRTSAREAHQKEIVDLMVEAKGKSAASTAAIAEHFKKSGVVMNAFRSLSLSDLLPQELQQKRLIAQRSRHDVIARTLGTIRDRRASRGGDAAYDEKVYDRYTRRYHILQDIVIKPIKEEEAARMEGLSLREKGALEKIAEHYNDMPAPVRILTTSALLTMGGAVAMGGGALPLLLGSAAAAASMVSAYFKKRGAGQLISQGIASITSVTGLVGLALNYAVRGAHGVVGTEKKAEAHLARESGPEKEITDCKNFKDESQKVRVALKAGERVKRDAAIVSTLGSLATGAFIGHHLSDSGAESTSAEQIADTNAHPAAPEVAHSSVPNPAPVEAHGPVVDAAPVHANHEGVIAAGDGADSAFNELQTKLRVEYAGVKPEDMPPAVREVLEARSPNELSREFGFAVGNESHVMQVGDSIGVVDGKLVFTHDGQQQVLMDHTGKHPIENDTVSAPVVSEREAPAPAATEHHDAPVAQVRETVAPVEHAPPVSETTRVEVPNTTPVEQEATPATEAPGIAPRSYSPEEVVRMHDQAPEAPAATFPTGPNPFGVTIDVREPHLYSFKVPGTDQEYVSVYGGQQDALDDKALEYLKEHPNAVVLYDSPQTALDGSIHYRIDAFTLGNDGNVVPVPEFTDGVITPDTHLNPDYFTRPIRP